jgi:flagellar biosynthesis protein FlhA
MKVTDMAQTMKDKDLLGSLRWSSEAVLAACILGALFIILIPLPRALMDALLLVNIAGSLIILMTAANVARPLDFNAFPSLILVVTFFRLALNVATTRLILGNAGEHKLAAAGQVVQSFAEFVAGSNLIVGFAIFTIIVVVQFVVITKGTTRISEVAARFTLDAMPGKQLSIDSELAAGVLTDEEARVLRKQVGDEAEFYGSMDGASKFVRGEAVAGIFILLTSILGGFFIGTISFGMDLSGAASLFTRLTVGDGLVTQVPSLMVSVATALLVTKSAGNENLGRELGRQLFASDRIFFVTAIFLVLLLPSGLPPFFLLTGATVCAGVGMAIRSRTDDVEAAPEPESESVPFATESPQQKARSLLVLEPIELEIGFRLIGLVDEARGGDLMVRLARMREKIAVDLGLVVPAVKVLDNTRLHPAEYSIRLRGNRVGHWRVKPERYLATAEGDRVEGLTGTEGLDPLTGNAGIWVDESQCSLAASAGYRLCGTSEIITSHLDSVIRRNAAEVLSREEVSRLISDLRKRAPALVDELIPGTVKMGEVHKILQSLLREQVSIRDLETILETLADHGDRTRDAAALTEYIRRALARTICASLADGKGTLHALLLDPALEEFLQSSVERADRGSRLAMEPEVVEDLIDSVAGTVGRFAPKNAPRVLVCSGAIRAHLRTQIAERVPQLAVLGYEEVTNDYRLQECGTVELEQAPPLSRNAPSVGS